MEKFRLPRVDPCVGIVHVWVAVSCEGNATLKVLEQNVNAAVYRDIPEVNLIPWV